MITFVSLLWTDFNSLSLSLQIWTQYYRWLLTIKEQRGRITSLALLASQLLMQDTVGILGCECTLLVHVELLVHQQPQGHFQSTLCPVCICTCDCMCRTLHLLSLNLMKFAQAHLSSLFKSIWMASQPSSVSGGRCGCDCTQFHCLRFQQRCSRALYPIPSPEEHHWPALSMWTFSH